MAKRRVTHRLGSYGIYDGWDRDAKELPKLLKTEETVPATLDIEFGYIINIKGARGKVLEYCIEHPPFEDEKGNVAPPFDGDLYVRSNDWDFFLGDKVWAPVDDKVGEWRMVTKIEGEVLEDRVFEVVPSLDTPFAT